MTRAVLAPVCSCEDDVDETDHELLGVNPIGRPVWECLRCGESRVGPFASAEILADREVAADGGIEQ